MARQKNDGRGRLGGRQKGTPNRNTTTLRDIITQQWHQYHTTGQFAQDIAELDPATRASLMEKYAQYIAPKMKSIDMDITQDVTLTIEDRLRQLCDLAADNDN